MRRATRSGAGAASPVVACAEQGHQCDRLSGPLAANTAATNMLPTHAIQRCLEAVIIGRRFGTFFAALILFPVFFFLCFASFFVPFVRLLLLLVRWGVTDTQMGEIARATNDYNAYPKLFQMLWKRLTDTEHVMHVQKVRGTANHCD